MGQPAATANDTLVGIDLHTVLVRSGPPALLRHPYVGSITAGLVSSVPIEGNPAAT